MQVLLLCVISPAFCAESNSTSPASAAPLSEISIPNGQPVPELTIEKLQTSLQEVSTLSNLTEENRTAITDLYTKSITLLKAAETQKLNKQQFQTDRLRVPEKTDAVTAMLNQFAAFQEPIVPPAMPLEEIEQKLTTAQAALQEAQRQSEEIKNEPKRREDRLAKIPDEILKAKDQLTELKNKLNSVDLTNPDPLARANRINIQAQIQSLQIQIDVLTEEQLFYNTAGGLLSRQRDLAARKLELAQKNVQFWQDKAAEARKAHAEEAKKEAIKTEKEVKTANPYLKVAAERNAEWAKRQTEIVAKIEKVTTYKNQISEQLKNLEDDYIELQEDLEVTGRVTEVMGVILLTKRNSLLNVNQNKKQIKDRLSEISLTRYEGQNFDRQWAKLANVEQQAELRIKDGEYQVTADEYDSVYKQMVSLYQDRRKILQSITGYYSTYADILGKLDAQERKLVSLVEDYTELIDSNILWIKSTSSMNKQTFQQMLGALQWLAQPHWKTILTVLMADMKKNQVIYLLLLLLFPYFLSVRPRLVAWIKKCNENIKHKYIDSFLYTLISILITVILAAPVPALILFFQWRLTINGTAGDSVTLLSEATGRIVNVVFILLLTRKLTTPWGPAVCQLGFTESAVKSVRLHSTWFLAGFIPVLFIFSLLQQQTVDVEWYNSLGRILFWAELVVLTIFLLVLFRPGAGLVGSHISQHPEGWIKRLRFFWYPLCLAIPIIMAVMAGAGYFYAATFLFAKLQDTLLLIFGSLLLNALLHRWLAITHVHYIISKKLKITQQRKEAETYFDADSAQPSEANPQPSSLSLEEQEQIEQRELEILTGQMDRLIHIAISLLVAVGVWMIWSDVIPAFQSLAKIELWQTTDSLGNKHAFYLYHVIQAVITAVLTFLLARNLPGLLEMLILKKLPLDTGVRFAITSVLRYLLSTVGIVLAFGFIGITWKTVQWLVAAVSVGLGFGLQEVFANFVCGLIILFEQPIRVGDYVTIGDISGTVTQIHIRATTLRKWDQKEMIVPNREFITNRLINWTLTDKTVRVDFPVGVAYGSDTKKVEKTLYKVAYDHPLVIKNDPKPIVIFQAFGDSSLNFELRVFLPSMDSILTVRHEINSKIDDEFRKAGIEIAFPQHDLHIRSIRANFPDKKPER